MSRRETHERATARTVAALGAALDHVFPTKGPCGICGDTIVGQRHRVMDAIAERIRLGEPWECVVVDWLDLPGDDSTWTDEETHAAADFAIYALAVSQ